MERQSTVVLGGIQNLNKRHRGGKSCRDAKIKRDRDVKKMRDGSLLSFLKLKAIPVPSTVQDAGPAMIGASEPIHPTLASMASRQPLLSLSHVGAERSLPVPSLGIQNTGSGFIKRFEEIVKCLLQNIPIGSRNDKLAAFNIKPTLLNDPKINPDDLWEVVINGTLGGAEVRFWRSKRRLGHWGRCNYGVKKSFTSLRILIIDYAFELH